MNYSYLPIVDVLAKPIFATIDAQHEINNHTINMIQNYTTDNKFINNTYFTDKTEISIPQLSLVQIPSLGIKKFNFDMSLENKPTLYNNENYNLDVKLTNYTSKWKTIDSKIEVSETSVPIGLTKLNSILADQIKIKSIE